MFIQKPIPMKTKGLLTFLMFLFLGINLLLAQPSSSFNYQAVLRNSEGELIINSSVSVKFSILIGSESGEVVFIETHKTTTSSNGVINLLIGEGTNVQGNIDDIDWTVKSYFLRVDVDPNGEESYINYGTSPLVAVPFALDVMNKDDADADSTNEIQNLYLDGDQLGISNGNQVPLNISPIWQTNGESIYITDQKVGIGSQTPVSKLEVKADATADPAAPLFEVINASNDTVFAVYPDGVVVFVNPDVKGRIGGFAVSGKTPGKTTGVDYLRITQDSTRVYVDQSQSKGRIGGFAVSGRTPGKTTTTPFMDLTPDNYFIGHESGLKTQHFVGSDHGKYNVFFGYQAGKENLTGLKNVFIGYNTGMANTHGMNNVFLGTEAGYNNDDGYDNVFIGAQSGFSNIGGINNVFLGYWSGHSNESGQDNVFVGFESGYNNVTGERNTFIGKQSGRANVNGSDNIFIGELSGLHNESGSENIFIGKLSGHYSTQADSNTFIGSYSGQLTTTGQRNTFLGFGSGLANSEGSDNTFIGTISANRNDVGSRNVALGYGSAGWMKGNENTTLGTYAGFNLLGDGNVCIGYKAGSNETGSNRLYIENSVVDSNFALIYGQFDNDWVRINQSLGVGRNPETYAFEVNGEAFKTGGTSAWMITSDKRIKTDISDIKNALKTVLKLRPVKYRYTDDYINKHQEIEKGYHYSFIAQEYAEVFPESVRKSNEYLKGEDEPVLTIDVHNAHIYTVKAVQELAEKNATLENENNELKKMLKALEERVTRLENKE